MLVLVVDDDANMRTLLELALTAGGYSVVSARNGREALDVARDAHPQLILLDLAMPILDGFGFRSEQLRDQVIAAIPVICISGRHDAIREARALDIGHCIAKPFDIEVVIAQVRRVLGAA